jgi:hypothetical protein
MIAMQYSIVLPADYDMAVIRERIETKGPLTDDFPGLVFKAFLHASRGLHGAENLYAPFYLWEDVGGMNRFLTGPGFVALTQSFGWPAVKTWPVLHGERTARVREARHATRQLSLVAPHADLAALKASETDLARDAIRRDGALASVAAYEPGGWSLVRFQLWRDQAPATSGEQRYEVGHVSAPGC